MTDNSPLSQTPPPPFSTDLHVHEVKNPRARIAIFNPIFAHYRSALIRELRHSRAAEYHFFADEKDGSSRIPPFEFGESRDYTKSPYFRLPSRIMWQPQALKVAWSGEYDCFIFMGDATWLSTWLAAVLARLRGRRVLFWTHGWVRRDRGAKKWVRLLFYCLSNGLLLYGDRAKRIGTELGYSADKLHVIYNSLDFDAQRTIAANISPAETEKLRRHLFGETETPVVIAAARLTSKKRFDLVIEAISIVNRDFRRVNLLVIGDGPERNTLEAQAASARVDCAFVGACYDERKLAAYFLAASVTVSPGNVGLTCMHSLGYGIPVITHDDPDDQMPEWEAIGVGITGDIFRKGSAMDLAIKIENWTRTSIPSDLTRTACISAVESRYHPKTQAARIESAALNALAQLKVCRDREFYETSRK